MDIWNVGILPQHYTASQPWRWRHGLLKRWYPTTTLHGVTTQKISKWNTTAVKASKLAMKEFFKFHGEVKQKKWKTETLFYTITYQSFINIYLWMLVSRSRHSSVVQRWPTGWIIEGFESWQGLGIFLFTIASRAALGPTQPPSQWVPGVLSVGVKRPVCAADHSPTSSTDVKEWVELYIHSPIRLRGVVLS
jgi:hypothetical protein